MKFIESNDTSQLIFASVTTIPAKDAEPLQVVYKTLDSQRVVKVSDSKISHVHDHCIVLSVAFLGTPVQYFSMILKTI